MRARLVERWGERVAPAGVVDRDAVAAIVFEDADERSWLESELHPRVAQRTLAWRSGLGPETDVAVIEVPLLYETGIEGGFDAVIAVIAADELRGQRLRQRGDAAVAGREEAQLDQSEKAARADHVVRNDGSIEELERQLAAVLERLRASAGGSP
jgi:dephospho-CoA kinase